jgi:hypothetical protein|tara:strand:- start:5107 stop:5364 length:258 start_codon:yes stop_codon:yes gene_type:complete
MTDSSSEDHAMINELLQAKMETARSQTQMTHVMRIGTFHMEIVPTEDVDTVALFNQTLDKLIERYGDKLLEISMGQIAQQDRNYV